MFLSYDVDFLLFLSCPPRPLRCRKLTHGETLRRGNGNEGKTDGKKKTGGKKRTDKHKKPRTGNENMKIPKKNERERKKNYVNA